MKKTILYILLLWIVAALGTVGVMHLRGDISLPQLLKLSPPRKIVITFDDLPAARGDLTVMRQVTDDLIRTLKKYDIPAVGFVNEIKLHWYGNPQPFVELLQKWVDAQIELGNHSYSHLDPNTTSFEEYTSDILRGEEVTRRINGQAGMPHRYYRHTFLHTGPTPEYEQRLNEFLDEHGYIASPVTHDNLEWKYASIYYWAKTHQDAKAMKRVAKEYVKYMKKLTIFWEDVSVKAVGYEIPQIILLHANQLNADHLDDLIRMFKRRGYRFISMEEALSDKAYSLPMEHTDKGVSWLFRWMLAKGMALPKLPPVSEYVDGLYKALSEVDPPQF